MLAVEAPRPIRNPRQLTVLQTYSITLITGEYFVSSVSRQGDGNMLSRKARDKIGGECRRVRERFLQRTRYRFHGIHHIGLENQLEVFGGKFLSDQPCIRSFVEVLLFESDGKCLHRPRAESSHQRYNR